MPYPAPYVDPDSVNDRFRQLLIRLLQSLETPEEHMSTGMALMVIQVLT